MFILIKLVIISYTWFDVYSRTKWMMLEKIAAYFMWYFFSLREETNYSYLLMMGKGFEKGFIR